MTTNVNGVRRPILFVFSRMFEFLSEPIIKWRGRGRCSCASPGGIVRRQARFTVPLGVVLLFFAVLGSLQGCKAKKQKKTTSAPGPVSVMRLEPQTVNIFRAYVGRTEAWFTVEVRPQLSGYLAGVDFREGQHVQKGQLLFRIESAPFLAQVDAAEAQIARADADIQRAIAAEAKAEDAARRYAPLATTDAVPRQQYADALADVAIRKAEVEQARASRKIAEAGLQQARLRLSYTRVRAPVSGMIGMRQLTVGALTSADNTQPLATISQVDPIRITFSVPDADYLRYLAPASTEAKQRASDPHKLHFQVRLADGSVLPGSARFYALERAVNQETDTMQVTVLYNNPDDRLRPGEYAEVRSDVQTRPHVLLLPVSAIRETQGTQLVWIVGPKDVATQRVIHAEQRVGNAYVIESGLAPGDNVIVGGEQKLRPGDKVKPVLVSPQSVGETSSDAAISHEASATKPEGDAP